MTARLDSPRTSAQKGRPHMLDLATRHIAPSARDHTVTKLHIAVA
jgi:hypothetical protein